MLRTKQWHYLPQLCRACSVDTKHALDEAVKHFHDSDALLITAGAGMGVDSGLPDFRGTDGFWKAYKMLQGREFESMASARLFSTDRQLAWGFYGHRANLYRETTPHKGFHILQEIGKRKKGGMFVYTSNVDGQFQKAGYDEDRIVECHGSIHHTQCNTPCEGSAKMFGSGIASQKDHPVQLSVDARTLLAREEEIPQCFAKCGDILRPNVLMWGDYAWDSRRTDDQNERFLDWLCDLRSQRQTVFVIELGAGFTVPTIRNLSARVVQETGGFLLRINPREPQVEGVARLGYASRHTQLGARGAGVPLHALAALEAFSARLAHAE